MLADRVVSSVLFLLSAAPPSQLPLRKPSLPLLPLLHPQYEWSHLDFMFPSTEIRNSAIKDEKFIIGNPFPIDMDVYYKDGKREVFLTMPRFLNGTPVTLGLVTSTTSDGGPLISPYPNYNWHSGAMKCNGFTSVFRVAIDECQRLWIIDTGKIGQRQVCPPQIMAFDLRTDIKIFTYRLASHLYKRSSLFITPIVDVRDTCIQTMVYLADVTGFGIVVYDFRRNRAWRVENQLLNPTQSNATFTIAVYNRQLFFHALASISENAISLNVLDNEALWETNPANNPYSFKKIGIRDNTQSTAEAIDCNGNQFFGTVNPLGIGCWDSEVPYTRNHLKLVAQDDITLQFISGMKIIMNEWQEEELWALSCRFQKISLGTRKINEINYRIQSIPIKEFLNRNNKCKGPLISLY